MNIERDVLDRLDAAGVAYYVTGSWALAAYAEPRMTRDIDIVIDLRFGNVTPLCDAFPAPEFFVTKESAIEAIRSGKQFNVVHPASGNKIDFMISRDDQWSKSQMQRRQRARLFGTVEGFAASAEDIIVSKMIYYHEGGSEKHLRDITGILSVQQNKIDREYIGYWASRLKISEVWDRVLERCEQAKG